MLLAAPSYLAQHGRPTHPRELNERDCLGYAYRARSDVWRFVNRDGDEATLTPNGRLRVTNADALIPTMVAGLAIGELPDFMAHEFIRDGRLLPILEGWSLPKGGLYFVTPPARARPAKVEALARFFVEHLSKPAWR